MKRENSIEYLEQLKEEEKLSYKDQTILDLKVMDEFDVTFNKKVEETVKYLEETLQELSVDTQRDSKRVTAHKNQVARRVRTILENIIKRLKATMPDDKETIKEGK